MRDGSILDVRRQCIFRTSLLALCWVSSILLGIALSVVLADYAIVLIQSLVLKRVSIIGLLLVLFLPISMRLIAKPLSAHWIIYVATALRGISFGFCLFLLLISYSDSAWLLVFFLMFSGIGIQIPVFLISIRCLCGSFTYWRRNAFFCLSFAILLGVIDYCVISPFLITLMQ